MPVFTGFYKAPIPFPPVPLELMGGGSREKTTIPATLPSVERRLTYSNGPNQRLRIYFLKIKKGPPSVKGAESRNLHNN